ncbi:MAG: sel1 repeat family protein [Planctomycetes bacterium]|nr:sel1 repeat family protein [Planctomycetota bacterium]
MAERDDGYEQARSSADQGDAGALETLAATGHPRACQHLGALLVEDPDGAAQARGAALLRRAAEAGLARAQFRYGLLCAHGQAGVAQDHAEAARWCRAAAEQGLAEAQYNLALLHAAGSGVAADAGEAARWLRLAAIGGVAEAEGCLDLVFRDHDRPRTWDEADTRASVALARTDPEAPKSLRLAEYYVDPCLDLLMRRYRMERDRAEDIVQQFFCELEEPLEKGEHRGVAWKDSLRSRYDPARGDFRALLRRSLVNFARDWMRRQDPAEGVPPAERPATAPEHLAEHHREAWSGLLARFAAEASAQGAPAARAAQALLLDLDEGLNRQQIGVRLEVSERTASTALRLGGELLLGWLGSLIARPGADPAGRLAEGLLLLPGWLQYPSTDKRTRTRLFLALAARAAQGR